MATIMEKDSLIHLIAYARSIVSLRLGKEHPEYEKLYDFLAKKRNWIYSTSPEKIDMDKEVPPLQEIIKKYKDLPELPQFRQA